MCSIFGVLDLKSDPVELRKKALELSRLMRHRGPDWSGVYASDKAILAHERLSIVDVNNGAQPLYNAAHTHVLAVNGEIYNHQALRQQLSDRYAFQTGSDCEVILALYQEKGPDFLDDLQGMFAFALYDTEKDAYLIGRDHLGIIPLYMGHDEHGNLYVASEMKALVPVCRTIKEFPAGSYLWSQDGEIREYYRRDWFDYDSVKDNVTDAAALRTALEESVKSHLMSDVPYGVLLSGGLDSSVISAITKKYAARRVEDQERSEAWWPQLHSFAVGLEGSPDLRAAQEVANHLGTVHHEIHFTVQEGLDAIRDVIYHIETYDVTTIRASTPMYLMSRKIKAMGIKMVLSGEGADEVFGGYLYFHKRRTPANSTKRPCASCWRCICLTARAPTRRCPPGALRPACRSWTRNSSTWRCASTRKIKCAATAKWKNTSSANVSSPICRPAWPGAKKSSSPTASATAGSTR
jgi:asparagine synthase (glutamine-hydrolysing) (EC 6.3.5.4)